MIDMKMKIASLIMIAVFVLTSFTAVFADSSWTTEQTIDYLYNDGNFSDAPVKIIAIGIDSLLYKYELKEGAESSDYLFKNASGEYFVRKEGDIANLTKAQVISFFDDVKASMQALNEKETITASNLDEKTLEALQSAVAKESNASVKTALIELFVNGMNVETELKKLADSPKEQALYESLVFDKDKDIWDLYDDNAPRPTRPTGGSGSSSGNRRPGSSSTVGSGTSVGTAPVAVYNDVASTHWAYEYVKTLSDAGIVNGVGDNRFEPNAALTRAAYVKMLAEIVKANVSDISSKFSDVKSDEWYSSYIAWAVENGIITGYDDDTFGPDDAITREQMAIIAIRFAEKFNITLPSVNANVTYSDDATIGDYAREAVYKLQAAGIMVGNGDSTFTPKSTATRAETCKVISMIFELAK